MNKINAIIYFIHKACLAMISGNQAWNLVETTIAFLSLLFTAYASGLGRTRVISINTSVSVFFIDSKGFPISRLSVLFPDGSELKPNPDGLIVLRPELSESLISIRSLDTRQEFFRKKLSGSVVEIIVLEK